MQIFLVCFIVCLITFLNIHTEICGLEYNVGISGSHSDLKSNAGIHTYFKKRSKRSSVIGFDNNNLYSKPCESFGIYALCGSMKLSNHVDCSEKRKKPVSLAKLLANISPIIKHLTIFGDVDLSTVDLPVWEEMLTLNITGSCVKEIDSNFLVHFPRLQTLQVVKARLQTVPVFAHPHTPMRQLILSDNEIRELPPSAAALSSLTNLEVLNLASNRLRRVTSHFFPNNCSLLELNLHNNQISLIDEGIGLKKLTKLRILRLSKNNLNEAFTTGEVGSQNRSRIYNRQHQHPLPSFRNVNTLDLSKNNLVYLPPMLFAEWQQLKTLKLRRNQLEFFGAGSFYIEKGGGLTKLDLSHNKMDIVTTEMTFGLDHLERFQLQHNRIRTVQFGALEKLTKLTFLDLRYNLLNFLSKVLQPLPSLKILRLDNNPLKLLAQGTFSSLLRLSELHLSNCNISVIDEEVFEALNRLETLNLESNRLTMLRGGFFRGLVELKTLNLGGNNITGVEESENNDLWSMIRLSDFKIRTSHFHCGLCSLGPFMDWIRSKKFDQDPRNVNITCASPEYLRGRDLLSLRRNDLSCQIGLIPKLMTHPSSEEKLVSENLTLSCTVLSSVKPTVRWERIPLHQSPEFPFARSLSEELHPVVLEGTKNEWKARLKLYNLGLGDAGTYRCNVTTEKYHGSIKSLSAEIRVLQPPVFTARPLHQYTKKAGDNLQVPCTVRSYPKTDPILRRLSSFPAAMERRMSVLHGNVSGFLVTKLSAVDSGDYICSAENGAGRVQARFVLIVHTPPTFSSPDWLPETRVLIGQKLVLNCAVKQVDPVPTVHWFKNDVSLSENLPELVLNNLRTEDAGTYRCVQNNTMGTSIRQTVVSVHTELPTFNISPKDSSDSGGQISNSSTIFYIMISAVICVFATTFAWGIVLVILRRRSRRQLKKVLSQSQQLVDNSRLIPNLLSEGANLPKSLSHQKLSNKSSISSNMYKSEPSLALHKNRVIQLHNPTNTHNHHNLHQLIASTAETSDYNTGSECSSSAERLQREIMGNGLVHSQSMHCSLNYSTVHRCTSFTGAPPPVITYYSHSATSPDSGCEASSMLTGSSRGSRSYRRPYCPSSASSSTYHYLPSGASSGVGSLTYQPLSPSNTCGSLKFDTDIT